MPENLEGLISSFADRYRIDIGPDGQPCVLGKGGMATVYRAYDVRHDRPVAIKVLHEQLAAILGAERFVAEIRVTARLQHPHIVPLLDSGVADGRVGTMRPWYVMPLVSGETLSSRIERDGSFSLSETRQVLAQVASALDYAHARGVIHRDIKPSNIILSGSFALVVDFGLARAVDQSTEGGNISLTGIGVGTPLYMSPEQGQGDSALDARTDVYSLGCVIYEMLTGKPPYTDSSPYRLVAQHRAAPIPRLREKRPDLNGSVAAAVETALAKAPEQRFPSAGAFAHALASGSLRSRSKVVAIAVAAAMTIAGTSWLFSNRRLAVLPAHEQAFDTLRYVVIPAANGDSAALSADALLQEGLEQWRGITVVKPFQVEEALARRGGEIGNGRDFARMLGAGRFVRVRTAQVGGRLRLDAEVLSALSGAVLRDVSVFLPKGLAGTDSAFRDLAGRLLLDVVEPNAGAMGPFVSTSVPARRAFASGHAALAEWNLAKADSSFALSQTSDPDFAAASLWLAQVRVWSRAPPSKWRTHAEVAAARRDQLSPDDRDRSDALVAMSKGDIPSACARWQEIATRRPGDFVAWYSLGLCLVTDSVVVPDHRSRSGWRFRSSYAAGVKAYQRAFELLPSVHRAFQRESFAELQRRLGTSRTDVRFGWPLSPDSSLFVAYLIASGDSLVYVPFPVGEAVNPSGKVVAAEILEAEIRQRLLFRDIATAWVTAYPSNPSSLEALAVALDLLGDPAALDTLVRARNSAPAGEERVSLTVAEIWLRLKLSVPRDLAGLRRVRLLADSLLTRDSDPQGRNARQLAGIAALVGRADLSVKLAAGATARTHSDVPTHIRTAVNALTTYASMGGPADSIRAAERLLVRSVGEAVPVQQRGSVRLDWARAATLALPEYLSMSFNQLRRLLPLLEAQLESRSGNFDPARRLLSDLRSQRADIPPATLAMDALYSEARLHLQIGDTAAAIQWLDPTFSAIHLMRPSELAGDSRPGALVRAMALRADLAASQGDSESARLWAQAVLVLWSGGDRFLRPLIQRMTRLAA